MCFINNFSRQPEEKINEGTIKERTMLKDTKYLRVLFLRVLRVNDTHASEISVCIIGMSV